MCGVVQGVGMRPFVYRLAADCRIRGWVRNDGQGVTIHAEGTASALDRFVARLRTDAPPAAVIADLRVADAAPAGFDAFRIVESDAPLASPTVRIAPDLPICAECLRELFDPADGRFEYPYINCTNCGPRYSIIRALPYDRASTTMSAWPMCPRCAAQYADPADRRFHAQPVACPACGPTYVLERAGREPLRAAAAMGATADLLRRGAIVGIKGIGGYHLACDAANADAVARLRTRKFRKEKPFALMARDLPSAERLIELGEAHRALLTSAARPIVLAPARVDLPGVAPDQTSLGVMLPYAPLHALLFAAGAPDPIVLTSANRSDEPIAYRDDEARQRLADLADALLVGEREIARRVDDSVAAVRRGRPFMLRRSRGWAPASVGRLPAQRPILALGADLKNTLTLVVDGEAFVSQHLGDLDDAGVEQAFRETVRDLLAMYAVDSRDLVVACDLHPEFVSTRHAAELPCAALRRVQHHHAHIASVAAEHGLLDQRVLGLALDGTGYGTDGAIWGCEYLLGSVAAGFERVASLRSVSMPGGDAAARWPVQAAAGFLAAVGECPALERPPFEFPARYFEARAMVERGVRCFVSTSAGRLFDAAAALLGFTRESTYEGQAAIWMEAQARRAAHRAADRDGAREVQDAYPFDGVDFEPLLRKLISDRLAGVEVGVCALRLHVGFALGLAAKAAELAQGHGLSGVMVSGGVFQNELLLDTFCDAIRRRSAVTVWTNERVPVNDGGISLGQAAIAAALDARGVPG